MSRPLVREWMLVKDALPPANTAVLVRTESGLIRIAQRHEFTSERRHYEYYETVPGKYPLRFVQKWAPLPT